MKEDLIVGQSAIQAAKVWVSGTTVAVAGRSRLGLVDVGRTDWNFAHVTSPDLRSDLCICLSAGPYFSDFWRHITVQLQQCHVIRIDVACRIMSGSGIR